MTQKEEMRGKAEAFFREADEDGTGCLDKKELCKILRRLGFKGTIDDLLVSNVWRLYK